MPRSYLPYLVHGEARCNKLRHNASRRIKVLVKHLLDEGIPEDEVVQDVLKLKAELRTRSKRNPR